MTAPRFLIASATNQARARACTAGRARAPVAWMHVLAASNPRDIRGGCMHTLPGRLTVMQLRAYALPVSLVRTTEGGYTLRFCDGAPVACSLCDGVVSKQAAAVITSLACTSQHSGCMHGNRSRRRASHCATAPQCASTAPATPSRRQCCMCVKRVCARRFRAVRLCCVIVRARASTARARWRLAALQATTP